MGNVEEFLSKSIESLKGYKLNSIL